jgi:hypothetical protein
MITEIELKEMYDNNQIEKFVYPNQLDYFYFLRINEELPRSINTEILARNKLKVAFSVLIEWWGVYNGRLTRLKTYDENIKFENVVIFISQEESHRWGLCLP